MKELGSAILVRTVREEVRGEIQDRLVPRISDFFDSEVGVVSSMISESSDELQKAHLRRLCTDLEVIQHALDAMVAMSAVLLQDR